MIPRRPPRLALLLLRRLGPDRDALAGDLVEELEHGRTRFWFWRQVIAAAIAEVPRARKPIALGIAPEAPMPSVAPLRRPNPSGTSTFLVGVVGVLAIGVFVEFVVPGFWWLLAGMTVLGTLTGLIAIAVTRRRSRSRGLALFLTASAIPVLALAEQPPRPAVPIDAVTGILDAFKTHQVVMLPGGFGASRAALLDRLLRDPRFQATVSDVVVEYGSSRYQDVMDRYIRGEDVPYEDLRQAWQDVPTPTGSDSPLVEDFYRNVREINASLPAARRLRVLLGEPPLDWRHVRTAADHRKWTIVRDGYTADLIRREVVVRGRRALTLYGQLHYPRKEINANYDMSNWQAQTLTSALEAWPGTRVFVIYADAEGVVKTQPDAAAWPHMSLALVRGTTLGAADYTTFERGVGQRRYAIRGENDYVPIPREQFSALPMQEQVDAILYTGGGAPEPPLVRISPRACADPGYVAMRRERIAVAGLPAAEIERIVKACAEMSKQPPES
jgi:hypothetical protein